MECTRELPHAPEQVFEFLSNLHNHWRLEDAFVELNGVAVNGGVISMRGPFGFTREARTTMIEVVPGACLRGRAEVGPRTVGLVTWELAPVPSGTRVTLHAAVERAGLADRLLLLLGGRAWLRRRFGRVLERLEWTLSGSGGS